MQAVILAGGLGTRMHPRTLHTPKSVYDTMLRRGLRPQRFRFDPCGARIGANFS